MTQKTILITGGAGYIGSHVCKAVAEAGFLPVAFDALITGHEQAVQWGPLVVGDIRDKALLDETLREHAPIACIHFAASSNVGESTKVPLSYYDNNVSGSTVLLQALENHGIRQIVFSSTCAVYGTPERLPIDENEARKPINPYGRSKLMIEWMLEDLCIHSGFDAVALRYFNAAGADEGNTIGENHDPETHLIPLALKAAGNNEKKLSIFGTDYDTPDGTCIRDYIHVTDLAVAHVKALQSMLGRKTTGFSFFNLGSGSGFSVREVAETCKEITGLPLQVVEGERRTGDPAQLTADPSKAMKTLDWSCEHSSLDKIVKTAWAWENK